MKNVLSVSADSKTIKGVKYGYLTGILYLAPGKLSGYEVCPKRTAGCTTACLYSAGRGAFSNVQQARLAKTKRWFEDRESFIQDIKYSIVCLERKAKRMGLIPVVRLNGTSDIVWESLTDIIQTFSHIQFYDYTKIAARLLRPIPKNYHLTLSLAENNDKDAIFFLSRGGNVAGVFRLKPKKYLGAKVVNGDDSDLRFLDKKGTIVALTPKGRAKKDESGFVR